MLWSEEDITGWSDKMAIDEKLSERGKVLVRDGSVCFEQSSFAENIFINHDLWVLFHLKAFAKPSDEPKVYYQKRELTYDNEALSYLWLTHILPIEPASMTKQLHGLKKISKAVIEQAREEDLDLILTTGTTYFNPSMAEKFGFETAFSAGKYHFYIVDMKDKVPAEDGYKIYRIAFPKNPLIRFHGWKK